MSETPGFNPETSASQAKEVQKGKVESTVRNWVRKFGLTGIVAAAGMGIAQAENLAEVKLGVPAAPAPKAEVAPVDLGNTAVPPIQSEHRVNLGSDMQIPPMPAPTEVHIPAVSDVSSVEVGSPTPVTIESSTAVPAVDGAPAQAVPVEIPHTTETPESK